jgi:predicted  nucleic acid-binding Zn-ribbon protein
MSSLDQCQEDLSAARQQYSQASEALHLTNEELLLIHEALQTTLEKFETSNDRMRRNIAELEDREDRLVAELDGVIKALEAVTSDIPTLIERLKTQRALLLSAKSGRKP